MRETDTRKRSLHVFGALSRGGAETWFLQALAHRGASRWVADVCLLADQEGACVPEARALGAPVLHCPYRPAATFPARFLRLLRRERYDVVHSHVLLFSGVVCALAHMAGVPVRAAHAHNASDGRPSTPPRELYRVLMRRTIAEHANLVLACSVEAARIFDAPDPRILPYGIDLQPFTQPAAGIPTGSAVLGAVGRLVRQKNHAFLLEAFAEALRLRPDLSLVIAGAGELAADLENQIRRLGLEGRVRLLGERRDAPALLRGLAGFVMPSLHEGLPVALLEAQAAGLPCLISDAISAEATVLPEQVERLPLSASWAERLATLPSKPRLDPSLAAERLRRAGFDVRQSWPALTALYDERLEPCRSAEAA